MIRKRILLCATVILGVTYGSSFAQTWPTKPLRVVLGLPPATIVDIAIRRIGPQLEKQFGQPVIVENRVGANSTIAANIVVRAPPDGHTFFFGNSMTIHPVFMKNSVDAGKDLLPVGNVLSLPYILYSSSKLPVKSFADLVAWTKNKPSGKLNFSSQIPQLTLLMQVIGSRSGITFTSIPYSGGGPAAILSLLLGDTDVTLGGVAGYPPYLKTGQIRALLITAPKRFPLIDDVPTTEELGLSNLNAASNMGIWAPKGTPLPITEKLSAAIAAIVSEAEIMKSFLNAGAVPLATTPADQMRLFASEVMLWTEAAKLANYHPE